MQELCPCCSGVAYEQCCAPYHLNQAVPETAVTLMRSRYTAYVLKDESYLRATWHSTTCPLDALVDIEANPKWLGLEVKNTHADGERATVEFVARYKINGRAFRLHETSQFVRERGRWFYVEGSFSQ